MLSGLPFAEEFISGAHCGKFNTAFSRVFTGSPGSHRVEVIEKCNTLCFGNSDFPIYKTIDWVLNNELHNSGLVMISGRVTSEVEQSELLEFFESSPIALHWLDSTGMIVWANQVELQMLGYTAAEFVGHHMAEVCAVLYCVLHVQ